MFSIPKDEIKRKGFHLLSLVYVFGYWYLPKNFVILGLIVAIIIVALLEYGRFKVPAFNNFFKNNFKGFYRFEEADKISAVIWTLLGALIAILMFSNKYMVFASFLYLSFGDAVAALVGKTFGKHKAFAGKSLEGSLSCLAVCFMSGLFLFNWRFALTGAVIAMIIEAVPWKLSDNFWMQIINAGILTLISTFMVWVK
ncbi:phosphatidate cytidylyltransferase [Endomicrobiia bacterium]|nr:phosphatidate cytidylyltransferase [Endomicrobiia bacterium]GHT45458.1 phosphatidate cytidylyltransferase [Endomicrobiia bacterium]